MLAFFAAPLALTGWTTAAASDWIDELNQLEGGRPPEIAMYTDRLALCQHWSDDGGLAGPRIPPLKSAIAELKCEALEREERRLRSKYAKSPNVLKALDEANDAIYP